MSCKIAITGINGDIGSLLEPMFISSGFNCKNYDMDLIGVDRVLHLAAKSLPATCDEIINSNILFLRELVKNAEQSGVKELVFFSAASVYGSSEIDLVNENSPFQSPSIYGLSKALGEEILRESKLNVLVIRLPAVLGYRNTTNIMARWYHGMKTNEDIVYMNSQKLFNNFITVESIFNFLKVFTFCNKFDVINLASKRTMSVAEIVYFMKNAIGSSSKLVDAGNSAFFAVSTQKAEEKYAFIPEDPREALSSWINKKNVVKT